MHLTVNVPFARLGGPKRVQSCVLACSYSNANTPQSTCTYLLRVMKQMRASPKPAESTVVAGKYRLTAKLGQGGMAEVWEAINVDLDLSVALKLCRPEFAETPELAQRLIREAKAVARLSHPNIVRVFDTGLTAEGAPFVVMERLRGRTLRAQMFEWSNSQVDDAFLVRALMAVGEALDCAHRNGLVHRDVKPDNVFLAEMPDGRIQPKLLDFGIVKLASYDRQLTHTGMTLGSPAYMAPEQAGGEPDVDGRADLWAASVVLFEALAGRLPFDGDNYNALLRDILMEPVPDLVQILRGQGIRLTPQKRALANVASRGLQKPRAERWQSAREFVQALERSLGAEEVNEERFSLPELLLGPGGEGSLSGGNASGVSRKRLWAGLGVLLILVAAAAVLLLPAPEPTSPDAGAQSSAAAQISAPARGMAVEVPMVSVAPTSVSNSAPAALGAPLPSAASTAQTSSDSTEITAPIQQPARRSTTSKKRQLARPVAPVGSAATPDKPVGTLPPEVFKQPY